MVIAAVMVGVGVVMELFAVMGAPLGYQDESGFHVGSKRSGDEETGFWVNPSERRPAIKICSLSSWLLVVG